MAEISLEARKAETSKTFVGRLKLVDDEGLPFGDNNDAQWIFDSASNEYRLQTRDAGGSYVTRLVAPANAATGTLQLPSATLVLPNNEALQARNAADSDDVDLIKLNASDQAELGKPTVIKTGSSGGSVQALKLVGKESAGAEGDDNYISFVTNNSDNTETEVVRIRGELMEQASAKGYGRLIISLARVDGSLVDVFDAHFDTTDSQGDLRLGSNQLTNIRIGLTTSSKLGFLGTTPVARPSAYTVSNGTTDRSYDADSTTVAELADVLGTLIGDLQAYGLLQ